MVPKDFPVFSERLETNPSIGSTANPEFTVNEIPVASTAQAAKLKTTLAIMVSAVIKRSGPAVHWINSEYRKVRASCTACFFSTFFTTAISQRSRNEFTRKLKTA